MGAQQPLTTGRRCDAVTVTLGTSSAQRRIGWRPGQRSVHETRVGLKTDTGAGRGYAEQSRSSSSNSGVLYCAVPGAATAAAGLGVGLVRSAARVKRQI